MNQETLQELFVDQLRDLYDAEKQLVKALPGMAKAASSEDLAEAIRSHLEETKGHVTRLEKVFETVGTAAKAKPCKAMRGLIEEGDEAIKEEEEGTKLDLSIIAAAQRVEHYEISAYGTAKAMAEKLGNSEAVSLLEQTEEEESAADSKLTEIASTLYDLDDEEEDEEADMEDEEMATSGKASATAKPSKSPSRK